MAVNWGLGIMQTNPGEMFMQGIERGSALAKERKRENALSAFAMDPTNEQAVNDLIQVDPRLGIQVRGQQQAQMQQQRERDVTGRALRGEQGAMTELSNIDPAMYMKLDEATRGKVKQAVEFMSSAGMEIGRLPEEQRAAAWESYVRQAEASGLDIPTHYERYSPEAFRAAMAEAGQTAAFLKSLEPNYTSVAPGGTIYTQPQVASPFAAPTVPQPQLSGNDAAPIIAKAQETQRISPQDYQAFVRTVGEAATRQWMQKHGVVLDEQGSSLPPGFVLDN